MKYIQKISAKLDFLNHDINIDLKGRNLILTGKNGIGKTRFLNQLNNTVLNKLIHEIPQITKNIHSAKTNIINILSSELNNYELDSIHKKSLIKLKNSIGESDDYNLYANTKFVEQTKELKNIILSKNSFSQEDNSNYNHSRYRHSPIREIEHLCHQISTIQSSETINLVVSGIGDLNQNIQASKVTFNFFPAHRQSKITPSTNTTDLHQYINSAKHEYSSKLGQFLEQYLLNIRIEKSLALSEENDIAHANQINIWFEKFDYDLKFLFEDDSTQLKFDYKSRKFSLKQSHREFTFQSLSSGFTAIFDIYSDLLMRSRLLNILPNELNGVVLIDEIDAHLHISLQKKILPFLSQSFPEIQFIVSTHSPFVITSTNNDTVVYDLSTGEFFEDDLSRYSYESIIKGLFHVEVQSEQLASEIRAIAEILNNEPNNYEKLREIIRNITPYAKQLDVESKSFYFKALNYLLDNQELGDLDV